MRAGVKAATVGRAGACTRDRLANIFVCCCAK